MKKQFLLTRLLLLFALIVGGGTFAWGDEVVSYNLTPANGSNNTYTGNCDIAISGITWNLTGNSQMNPWRIGGKSISDVDRELYSKTAISDDITKIVVTHGAASSITVNSWTVIVSKNANFSDPVSTLTPTFTASSSTIINKPEGKDWSNCYFKFIYNVTVSGKDNKFLEFTNAKFYKEASASQVVTPSFLPDGSSTYTTQQSVTLSCSTGGATIHYTMTEDGTTPEDPTESDPTYSAAISVTKSGTKIKAKAFKADMEPSSVASATYTIIPTTPTISAIGATVTITGAEGCDFYYTTDNTTPSKTSNIYTGPFNLLADCTIKAIAYDTYGNASEARSFNYKYMPLDPKNINSGYFEKVTDASTLENGDAILIVNESANRALGPQSGNNCPEKTVNISGGVISNKGEALKLVLVKLTEKVNDVDTEVFYFYTGNAYLYASSSTNNYLKQQDSPSSNARATIGITSGDATITFRGSFTHNIIRYNSGNKLFSCYESGQQTIQIYKEVAHNEPITISSAKYATLCSDKALDFTGTGITAYTATDGETKVTLNEITSGQVPANTPVVLHNADADGTPVDVPVIASADPVGDNDLAVVTDEEGKVGVENMFVLSKPAGKKVGFYVWAVGSTLNKGKVYLQGKASYESRSFLGFDDETTGIEELKNSKTEELKSYFNLNGQRVTTPRKGLYIVNGKKVVIK